MILHQFWHDSDPPFPAFREYLRFSYDVVVWTPDSAPAALADLLAGIEGTVRPRDRHRHQANLVRYWVLHQYGGVWLDTDVIPIFALESHPLPYVAAHGTPCTCVMAFPKHHPMLQSALDAITTLPQSNASCVEASGDRLLARVITPDVTLRQLPFDAAGIPIAGAHRWAFHLYNTSYRNGSGTHDDANPDAA